MTDLYGSFQSLGKYETRVLLLFVTIGYLANAPARLEVLFVGTDVNFICTWNSTLKFENLANNFSVNQCSLNETMNLGNAELLDEIYTDYDALALDIGNASCPFYAFDHTEFDLTVSERYSLVCEKKYLLQYTSLYYLLGYVLGASLSGFFSDKFGRKKVLIYGALLGFVANVVSNYCPEFIFYLACRMFIGVADVSVFTSAAVLTMELVKKDQREVVQLFQSGMIGGCEITMGVLSMLIRHYRHLHLMIASIYFLCIMFYAFYLVESPRWLNASKQTNKARKVVDAIVKYNGTTKSAMKHLLVVECRVTKTSVLDLLTKPVIRRRTVILFFVWLAVTCARYGVVRATGRFSPDVRIHIIISGAIEAPVIVPVVILIRKFGRQITTFSFLVGSAVLCLTMATVTLTYNDHVLVMVLAICGKILTSSTVAMVYLFTQELLPTLLRNVGLGLCISIGHVGPLVLSQLEAFYWQTALFTGGALTLVAALCVIALPDTTWLELAPSLKECVTFRPGHVYSFCPPDSKLNVQQNEGKSRNGYSPNSELLTMESCVDL